RICFFATKLVGNFNVLCLYAKEIEKTACHHANLCPVMGLPSYSRHWDLTKAIFCARAFSGVAWLAASCPLLTCFNCLARLKSCIKRKELLAAKHRSNEKTEPQVNYAGLKAGA
ncbi:MAG TPA: hypothetical protein VLN58_14275, partial [Verrucomicrobiae bacterium]|nr:hypothetical protein [Verrucomicrobiae bacterium]